MERLQTLVWLVSGMLACPVEMRQISACVDILIHEHLNSNEVTYIHTIYKYILSINTALLWNSKYYRFLS